MKGALAEGFQREGGKWEKEDGAAPVYARRLAFKNGSLRPRGELSFDFVVNVHRFYN